MSERTVPALPPRHPNQHPPAVTRAKQRTYLEVLSKTGSHAKACTAAQITDNVPYEWASRSAGFAKTYAEAKQLGEKVLLSQYESNMDAVLLPEKPMPINDFARTQNSRFFRMKRLDPLYRDTAQVNVNVLGPGQCVFEVPTDSQAIDVSSGADPIVGAEPEQE